MLLTSINVAVLGLPGLKLLAPIAMLEVIYINNLVITINFLKEK
jgi:hypothetical protein